jgi:membrane-associated phospholipid phosphatase
MTQAISLGPRRAAPSVAIAGAAAAALAVAGILGLDTVVAQATAARSPIETPLGMLIEAFDLVALKGISSFLLSFVLIVAAGALLALKRRGGWTLFYVGLVQFLSTTIADLSKPPFGRLRPHEAMLDGAGLDRWFAGGQSFPSGHTAFYFGLFVPLIILWPRYTLLWLAIPLIVATQRLVAHDHYLSDVAASITLATLLSVGLAGVARPTERM